NIGGAGTNRIERIVEVRPPRHPAPSVRTECAGLPFPPGDGGLRGKDLVRRHALEPVVSRIEFAHVLKAQPAPVAGAIEVGPIIARRAEFAGLIASRGGACAPIAIVSAVELLWTHSVSNGDRSPR